MDGSAHLGAARAARMESAARRRYQYVRRVRAQVKIGTMLSRLGGEHGIHERPWVRVTGIRKHRVRRAAFNHPAGVQPRHPTSKVIDNRPEGSGVGKAGVMTGTPRGWPYRKK